MKLFETALVPGRTVCRPSDDAYRMYAAVATLIDRLDNPAIQSTGIIPWGAPVPSFGDLSTSRIATVGLNPSNREFLDATGVELRGTLRRFHTLESLRLASWSHIDVRHLRLIVESCRNYFHVNPYNRWFKRLDEIIVGTHTSYYVRSNEACHIDLVPYATVTKWGSLDSRQRLALLALSRDTLGILLRASSIRIVALNGMSVVQSFQAITGVRLTRRRMPNWSLGRSSGQGVPGFSFTGQLDTVSGVPLGRSVLVLGFNHNLQSSYGMTRKVIQAIGAWVREAAENELR